MIKSIIVQLQFRLRFYHGFLSLVYREISYLDRNIHWYISPTDSFFEIKSQARVQRSLFQLYHYLKPYKQVQFLLLLGILIGTAIQFTIPFLFQTIIDTGIKFENTNFITIVLSAQLALIVSKLVFDLCRDYLLLNISIRLNTHIIYDFLAKMLTLPLTFFDTKMTGDILRRIEDNNRIEKLLSSSTLNFLFSVLTFIVFGIVLAIYNYIILLVYIAFTALYIVFLFSFLKKRAEYDMRKFYELSQNQNLLLQVIHGISEIKLNNSENYKKQEWSKIQNMIFKTKVAAARLVQFQDTGASLINELRNIIIIFISARLVISNNITLGSMLSIQYIIGFLNQAINLSVYFVREFQDAKISLERIIEIQSVPSEDENKSIRLNNNQIQGVQIKNLSFRYEGPNSPKVLDDINVTIKRGKIIAIVGTSGSGKTTLLKLLLNFYQPTEGTILIDGNNLNDIFPSEWRKKCGVVMQDGFIFSDTIAKNIALSDDKVDIVKLNHAMSVANISEFVSELPLKETTMIGQDGIGLSHGQKQRL
ncbi:ATP-binding cassette domain-containing protein [Mucilaginibacter sp. UR6-1]|uniref:peptidase domain-containing ABC transporter n=1 Tax=Mucilaginibacter sp. UR6-1 TaxID=1435643 RepID=UPI001E3F09B7|nr:ABC transporter transmembrane domain-containing protein [Mucilaginibacter sp. UR6-1]MCC8409093.1 ATP-binding cassette domain-containing protein [Mucilaginibacter sp. UR6-1]